MTSPRRRPASIARSTPAHGAAQRNFRFGVMLCVLLLGAAVFWPDLRLGATNHFIHIEEVMAGANGNSKIQFIVVEQDGGGQNLWGPVGSSHSRAMLVFFDATGRETGKFKFTANPPTNGSLKTLIATQEFANLAGAPTPDVIIPALLHPVAGKVCFKSNPSNNVFARNECLSYGGAAFTGAVENNEFGVTHGAAAVALPITGTNSLRRTNNTGKNADFSLITTPTPRNIANATFTMAVSSQIVQGENLFTNETFAGNGRTCSSCHVASESFGMTPGNVTTRFAGLTNTFDPQFIAENLPSTTTNVNDGFDFGLNTLVLTAEVATTQTPVACTGELRGIITGTTGRAKVLTRVSGTTYLVYGGRNPALSGTLTDGLCSATFQSIAVGNLSAIPAAAAGLEAPARMRTSSHAEFTQGRALILENIDGFPPTAPVFRKSPHLLNLSRSGPFGFSSDVASLQTFVTDAITQHFPRTLGRVSTGATPDFRLPTADEQAAMEAFMLAQEFPAGSGGDAKFNLDTFAKTAAQIRGRAAFFGTSAKCSQCHGGPVLARTTVNIQNKGTEVNARFNTGVVNSPINGAGVDNLPAEQGGAREFSVPQLFNVQRLGPFFHDNSAATLREAVEFYSSSAFTNSPAGAAIGGSVMSLANVNDIVAFLEGLDNDPNAETIANQTVLLGGSTGALALTLSDPDTALTSLVPTATSSNTTVVPNNAIVFGGSGANRTVTVTPAAGQLGTSTITITVSDGTTSTTTTFTVTTAADTAPTVSAVADQTINEDTATAALAVTVGDAETAVASLTLTGGSSNTTLVPNANIVLGGSGANRTVTVTPAADQFGTATITLTVGDGVLTANRTFLVTVTSVNDTPTITALSAVTINEDNATSAIAFTVGDVETAAGSLTPSGASSNTTLVPNANIVFGGSGAGRTVTVTPAANQFGTSTITVTISDGGLTANRTFTLTVTSVNDAPTLTALAAQTINEDNATAAIAFTVGDVETAAGSLTPSGSSSNTTLVPNASITFGGSGASRTVTVTPAANQFGTATITVNVTDGTATTSTTMALTVTSVNDAPTITALSAQTVNEDTATSAITLTVGDVETAAADLTMSGSSSDTTLVPNANVVFGGSGASRTVTVTPAANQFGTATITVTVNDGTTTTSTTMALTVTAVNDAPTVTALAAQTVNEDNATSAIAFTVGDVETAAGSLTPSGSSSNTTLVPNASITFGGSGASRTVTVTPAANQFGTATITVNVTDGTATTSTTMALTVTSVNDAPTVTPTSSAQTIAEDTSTSPITFTVGDVDTALTSLTLSSTSSNTTLVPNAGITFGGSGASRTVTVTPAANQFGTATITVSFSDGTASTPATIALTVTAVNDAPTISSVAAQTTLVSTATSAIAFTIGDVDTAVASLTVTASSSNATLVPNSGLVLGGTGTSRTVTATPAAAQIGNSTITLNVSDGTATTATTFVLTVSGSAPSITTQPGNRTILAAATTTFTVAAGGSPAPTLVWQSSSDGGTTWGNLSETSPYGGTTTSTLTVTSAPASLSGRQFRALATNVVGTVASSAATLLVQGPVAAFPASLQFVGVKNGATLTTVTSPQTLQVSFSGAASAWTATTSETWLQLTNASGSSSGVFTVGVINPGDVIGTASTLNGSVTLTPSTTGLSPVTVAVTLNVTAAVVAPFGAFDTPLEGASVAGSIPVSGWALDDVSVDRVELWRDRAAGEDTPVYPGPGPGTGKIFIANAIFVSGARPDIEKAYPAVPRSSEAGWGYLLLTQGLFNQGNGQFTFYAFAYDQEGRSTVLGSKTVTISNSTSVKPFGSIDVPLYGQTMTTSFWNFGWALTPNATPPCTILPTGVQVSIDSAPLTRVTYGDLRTDIASLFPGFSNGGGAGGAYFIDTTKLSNGTHQIGWFVTDNCGRSDGIGSRFFTVLNSSGTAPVEPAAAITVAAAAAAAPAARQVAADSVPRHTIDHGVVEVRRGGAVTQVAATRAGAHLVVIGASERVEIGLPTVDGGAYQGFQIVGGERRPLPLGSSLDAGNGIFYWQPGAGFQGGFDLEFASTAGKATRVRVVVVTAVDAAIDTPQPGHVSSPFLVSGWAVDEGATAGTGIDAVHVWAHPMSDAPAVFLGAAQYGGARPDAAAVFGDRFAGSGYELVVERLPSGVYDLVVSTRSVATGAFHTAKVVRVTVP